MNVNQTTFCTVTALAIVSIGSAVSAATAISTVTAAVYGVLATLGSALSIASMTAYTSLKGKVDKEDSAREYFNEIANHAGFAIAGVFQFLGQTLMLSVVEGFSQAITGSVKKKFEHAFNC